MSTWCSEASCPLRDFMHSVTLDTTSNSYSSLEPFGLLVPVPYMDAKGVWIVSLATLYDDINSLMNRSRLFTQAAASPGIRELSVYAFRRTRKDILFEGANLYTFGLDPFNAYL